MLDFGALPPEINSGRMYAGPGPGSMLSAVGEWQALADEINTAATAFGSIVSDLTGGAWAGPSSMSMATAATTQITWLTATAGQVQQTVAQLNAAVVAYDTALAGTVPPAVVAANRSLYAMLVATNLLGQNTAAIAAAEAHYLEMWAQDAGAMYGYAASSAAATMLTPFTSPPTSNPAGLTDQAASVAQAVGTATGTPAQAVMSQLPQLISATPQALQGLAAPGLLADLSLSGSGTGSTGTSLSSLSSLSMLAMPARMALMPMSMLMRTAMMGGLGGANAARAAGAVTAAEAGTANSALSAGLGSGPASLVGVVSGAPAAGLGRAASIGVLSVPPAWTAGGPGLSPTVATLTSSVAPLSPAAGGANGVVPPLLPISHPVARGGGGAADAQYDPRPIVIPRSPIGG